MYVSISELRQRITIERPVSQTDSEGNLIECEREIVATVWAKVLPYAAKISDGYAEKVDEIGYRIVIRYRADIQTTDIICWRGRTLIQSAPPYGMDGGTKYLVIEAKELVEDSKA